MIRTMYAEDFAHILAQNNQHLVNLFGQTMNQAIRAEQEAD